MIDAVIATEDARLLQPPRGRRRRHPARRLHRRREAQHGAGRLDAHRAAREERLCRFLLDRRQRRADLRPPAAFGPGEDPRGAARGEARATARQGSDPRDATSTPSTSGTAPTASRPPRRRTSASMRASSRSWSRPRCRRSCTRPSSTIRWIARATTGTGATTRSTRWFATAICRKPKATGSKSTSAAARSPINRTSWPRRASRSTSSPTSRKLLFDKYGERGGLLGRHACHDDP